MSDNKTNWLKTVMDKDTVELSLKDVIQPKLKILTSGSPETDPDSELYDPELKNGDFYHSELRKSLGNKVKVVCLNQLTVYYENEPGGGRLVDVHIICPRVDKTDYAHWLTRNGTEIKETLLLYILLPDFPELGVCLFSLASTALKHGKALNSAIYNTKLPDGKSKCPYFGGIWELSSAKNVHDKTGKTWYTLGTKKKSNIDFAGYITEEFFKAYVEDALDIVKEIIDSRVSGSNKPSQQVGFTENTQLPAVKESDNSGTGDTKF